MAHEHPFTPETVQRFAAELLDLRLDESDAEMLADLLTGLHDDMQPMRQMEVGSAEPATPTISRGRDA